jgi:hypothetical protein
MSDSIEMMGAVDIPEAEKYWPYGTPPPRRLIDGVAALDAVKVALEKLDTSKLTAEQIKTVCPTLHPSDIKEAVERYSIKTAAAVEVKK